MTSLVSYSTVTATGLGSLRRTGKSSVPASSDAVASSTVISGWSSSRIVAVDFAAVMTAPEASDSTTSNCSSTSARVSCGTLTVIDRSPTPVGNVSVPDTVS